MIKIAVFGGGCFWCTEAVFSAGGGSAYGGKMLKGVISVTPGYAGGPKPVEGRRPTYKEVCSGNTGHAEVIRIEYEPDKISFRDLLTVFFATHDSTTPNRQGGDIGTQYRSIILYSDKEQKEEAERFIKELNASSEVGEPTPTSKAVGAPTQKGVGVVTEVQPLKQFFEAEDYHKDYYAKNRENSYCQVVINPKLEKVQEKFSELLKQTESE